MPKTNRLAINFCEINLIINRAMPTLSSGERGFISKLNSELVLCENEVRDALQKNADDDKELIVQYQRFEHFLREMITLLKRPSSAENTVFKKLLLDIRDILEEHLILVQSALTLKQTKAQYLPELYDFATLLCGKHIAFNQSEDPFIGGYRENNILKASRGFCGGLVLSWVFDYLDSGAVRYPVIGHRLVQLHQDDQPTIRDRHFNLITSVDYGAASFKELLNKVDYKKAYYFTMHGETSAHAVGIKKYKNGSFHFYDPNFGVFQFNDEHGLSTFLSFYFAKMRRTNFPAAKFFLYESKKEVANPDIEPTPDEQTFMDARMSLSNTSASQQLAELVLEECKTLILEAARQSNTETQKKSHLNTLQKLMIEQVFSTENIAFRESARYIAMYFEILKDDTIRDKLKHVEAHLELVKTHNPMNINVNAILKIIQLIDQFQLAKNNDQLVKIGERIGQMVRKSKHLATPPINSEGQQLLKLFDLVRHYQHLLDAEIAKYADILKTLSSTDSDRGFYEMRFNGLMHASEKLIRSKLKNFLEFICLSPQDTTPEQLASCKRKAETALPGITGSMIVSSTIEGEVKAPISKSNVGLYLEDQIGNLQCGRRAMLIEKLDDFIKLIDSYSPMIIKKVMSDTVQQELTGLEDHLFYEQLQTVKNQLLTTRKKLQDFNQPLLQKNDAICTAFPITLQQLQEPNFVSLSQIAELYEPWAKQLHKPCEAEQSALQPYFDLLIANQGKALKDHIKAMLKKTGFDAELNAAHRQKIETFFENHIKQLSELFSTYLKQRMTNGATLGNKKLLVDLTATLNNVYGYAINEEGFLSLSSKPDISSHMKNLMLIGLSLQKAHAELELHLAATEAEYQKILKIDGDEILHLPLKSMLDTHYRQRISKLKDLKQSTVAQLTGLINNHRTISEAETFIQQQFILQNNKIDVTKTVREKLVDAAAQAKATSNLMKETMTAVREKINLLKQSKIKTIYDPQSVLRITLTTYEKCDLYDKHLLARLEHILTQLERGNENEIEVLLSAPSSQLFPDAAFDDFKEKHKTQRETLIDDFIQNSEAASDFRRKKIHMICVHVKTKLADLIEQFQRPDQHKLNISLTESADGQKELKTMFDSVNLLIHRVNSQDKFYNDQDITKHAEELRNILGCPMFSNNGHIYEDLQDRIKKRLLDDVRRLSMFSQLREWLIPAAAGKGLSLGK